MATTQEHIPQSARCATKQSADAQIRQEKQVNLDIIRQFNGLQINIQTNKWRTALVVVAKGKVMGEE